MVETDGTYEAVLREKIERLQAKLAEAEEEKRVLRGLLQESHVPVCELVCPSTGKAGTPIPHSGLCKRISKALFTEHNKEG